MHHAHSSQELAHTQGTFGTQSILGRIFCAIMLLAMLMVALLPTVGARGQDVETQTPTAQLPATGTSVVLTDTPADTPSASPVETQDLASPQSPTSTQDLASLTPPPTSTGQISATALDEASPSATLSATPPVDTVTASPVQSQSSPACQSGEKTATVKLDGITISVCAPILPGDFIIPDPSSSDQIATAATLNPYQEFSITAIPYGLKVSTETLPTAAVGLAGQYQQDLKNARIAQGGQVKEGPAASIFSSSVSSIASLVSLKIHGDTPSNVVIVEWVADAGNRLWIIRYSQEMAAGTNQPADDIINTIIQPLAQVIVSSQDIASPSTSAEYLAASHPPPPNAEVIPQAVGDLQFPSWWNGDCDGNNFPGSYALGGIYRGVKACGPINTVRVVRFAPGLWGELEWQCVELSMRFLYLAYGILPYPGNGKDVVWNYTPKSTDKLQLVKIANDTVGKFPQAGDVLSYGITSTYGHTSVVTGSIVDSSGNGTVTIIEQNVSSPSNGMETLTVTNWHVKTWMLITGWLHGNNPVPTISSISPTNVMAGTKGLIVSAFGTNFLSSSVMRWNGKSLATAFVSSTELIAAVPDSYITTSATASVTVYNPGPGGGTSTTKTFTINNPVPVLTSLSPITALIAGSSFTLTVTGSNYFKTSKVLWNGTALSTTFVSGTQLTASVPSSDLKKAGEVNITVSNPIPGGGTSDPQTFTVNNRVPVISSISPVSITVGEGSFTITLNGSNFAFTSKVRWDGGDLTTTYDSTTQLRATVPAGRITSPGTASVTVFSPAPGGGESSSITYNIDEIFPTYGSTVLTTRPTLDWEDTPGATSYTLQVSTSQSFSSYIVNKTVTPSFFTLTSDLALNKRIYWRTLPKGVFPATGSTVHSFYSANPPGVPRLSSPAHASLVNTYTPRLDWTNSSVPTGTTFDHYRLQVATDSAFTSLVEDRDISGLYSSEYTPTTSLAPNVKFYWRVQGFNTAGQYSLWSSVRYFRTPMLPPLLRTPENVGAALTTRPLFDWDDVAGATRYSIQVSTVPSFRTTVVNASVIASTYTPSRDLARSRTIYWRVRATGTNPSNWSDVFSFYSANPPSVPSLVNPTDGVMLSIYTPTLDWNDPVGAVLYELQVATTSTFTSGLVVNDQSIASSIYVPSSPLAANSTFYWRVRVYDAGGQYSNWSSVRHFHTKLPVPALVSPGNDVITTTLPTYNWSPVSGATGYIIQVSTSPSLTSPTINKTVTVSSYTSTSMLSLGRKYYWRVYAKGTYNSAWSEVRYFTTQ